MRFAKSATLILSLAMLLVGCSTTQKIEALKPFLCLSNLTCSFKVFLKESLNTTF
jgi:PBP1b-binding outer membrane lipoprotein LpoB